MQLETTKRTNESDKGKYRKNLLFVNKKKQEDFVN